MSPFREAPSPQPEAPGGRAVMIPGLPSTLQLGAPSPQRGSRPPSLPPSKTRSPFPASPGRDSAPQAGREGGRPRESESTYSLRAGPQPQPLQALPSSASRAGRGRFPSPEAASPPSPWQRVNGAVAREGGRQAGPGCGPRGAPPHLQWGRGESPKQGLARPAWQVHLGSRPVGGQVNPPG